MQLWEQAVLAKQQDARRGPLARFHGVPVRELALRGGVNRFGKFTSRYALPRDARADNITASLQRGYLRVHIPRVQRRRRMAPMRAAPASMFAPGMFW